MFSFRVRVLLGLLLAGFLVVLGRLAELQVLRASHFGDLFQRLRARERIRPALRGVILDRYGQPLARDVPSFDLAVRADELELGAIGLEDVRRARAENPLAARREEAFAQLKARLMLDPWVRRLAAAVRTDEPALAEGLLGALDQVARKWAGPAAPVTFLRGVDQAAWTALRAVQEDEFLNPPRPKRRGPVRLSRSFAQPADGAAGAGFPGLVCTHSARRDYPHGKFLAHVLGTLGQLSPEQAAQLRQTGTLMEFLAARQKMWAVFRQGLDDARAARLEDVLGADPRAIEDVGQLMAFLGTLDPDRRRQAAQLGMADFVRWSDRPPRMQLCEAERLWLGCGQPRGAISGSRPVLADARVGETGVEAWYNDCLRGKHGLDLGGRPQAPCWESQARPREGRALALTISPVWQQACESVLSGLGRPAAAVVLDCHSGEILALASLPGFDPNLFCPPREGAARRAQLRSLLSDPAKPLVNRAISERYPLGSAMKPLIAAVALELGLVRPEDTNNCVGFLEEGHTRYHCDGRRAHGEVDLREALRRSCNVYFYRLGARIGVERLAVYAHALGLGRRTGVDLPGEVSGIFPDRAWRMRVYASSPADQSWSRGKDYHLAIGQGYLAVTPLQVACVISSLANGGRPVTPRLWLEAPAAPGPAPVFSRRTLAVVREAMDEVCNVGAPGARGTAYRAFHEMGPELSVRVAGKTGTAEVAQTDAKPHAWFVGFAPSQSPEVAFSVFVENSGHGGEIAAPAAYRILKEVYGTRVAPRRRPGEP